MCLCVCVYVRPSARPFVFVLTCLRVCLSVFGFVWRQFICMCVCVYAAGLFVVLRTRLCVSGFICEFDRIAVLIAWNSICYGRADRHDS